MGQAVTANHTFPDLARPRKQESKARHDPWALILSSTGSELEACLGFSLLYSLSYHMPGRASKRLQVTGVSLTQETRMMMTMMTQMRKCSHQGSRMVVTSVRKARNRVRWTTEILRWW